MWKYDAIGVGVLFESSDDGVMVVASNPIGGSSGAAAKVTYNCRIFVRSCVREPEPEPEHDGNECQQSNPHPHPRLLCYVMLWYVPVPSLQLAKGDKVYSINGQSTASMTAIGLLDMMSNDNSDSLSLEVGRGGAAAGRRPAARLAVTPALTHQHPDSGEFSRELGVRETVVLARSKQTTVNPVTFSTKTDANGRTVGYIKLADFNSEAVEGVRLALVALEPTVDEYVLDLRGNTGGGFQVRVVHATVSCVHLYRSCAAFSL